MLSGRSPTHIDASQLQPVSRRLGAKQTRPMVGPISTDIRQILAVSDPRLRLQAAKRSRHISPHRRVQGSPSAPLMPARAMLATGRLATKCQRTSAVTLQPRHLPEPRAWRPIGLSSGLGSLSSRSLLGQQHALGDDTRDGSIAPIPDLPNRNPRRGTNLTLLHPTGGGVVPGVVEKPYWACGLLAVVRRALATRSDS
jgi:hypothetical protein